MMMMMNSEQAFQVLYVAESTHAVWALDQRFQFHHGWIRNSKEVLNLWC